MSILIKGMEMLIDTCEIRITIDQDGDWWARRIDTDGEWHEVVEVPTPHGRLIDADEYCTKMKARQNNCAAWRDKARENNDDELYIRAEQALSVFIEAKLTLDKMPTIIEAEEDDGN